MATIAIDRLANAMEDAAVALALPIEGLAAFEVYLSEYQTEQRFIKKDV